MTRSRAGRGPGFRAAAGACPTPGRTAAPGRADRPTHHTVSPSDRGAAARRRPPQRPHRPTPHVAQRLGGNRGTGGVRDHHLAAGTDNPPAGPVVSGKVHLPRRLAVLQVDGEQHPAGGEVKRSASTSAADRATIASRNAGSAHEERPIDGCGVVDLAPRGDGRDHGVAPPGSAAARRFRLRVTAGLVDPLRPSRRGVEAGRGPAVADREPVRGDPARRTHPRRRRGFVADAIADPPFTTRPVSARTVHRRPSRELHDKQPSCDREVWLPEGRPGSANGSDGAAPAVQPSTQPTRFPRRSSPIRWSSRGGRGARSGEVRTTTTPGPGSARRCGCTAPGAVGQSGSVSGTRNAQPGRRSEP